jgi:transcriptional regulator with GAF, ATPase, and Fis domain
MRRYDWPGNIRELKNVIERAVILSPEGSLRLDLSLPSGGVGEAQSDAPRLSAATADEPSFVTDEEMRLRQRDNLQHALDFASWRISGNGGAAELLGLRPSTLADRIRSYGLEKPPRSG